MRPRSNGSETKARKKRRLLEARYQRMGIVLPRHKRRKKNPSNNPVGRRARQAMVNSWHD